MPRIPRKPTTFCRPGEVKLWKKEPRNRQTLIYKPPLPQPPQNPHTRSKGTSGRESTLVLQRMSFPPRTGRSSRTAVPVSERGAESALTSGQDRFCRTALRPPRTHWDLNSDPHL